MERSMPEEWERIEPGVWKPSNEGDQIIGELVNKEPKDEIRGMSAKYHIKTEAGTFFVWGTTVLDDRMQYVVPGKRIRITFKGKQNNRKGQAMNLFTVDVAKEPIPMEQI